MAKAQSGKREAAKTLEQRFTNQASTLLAKGTSRSGKVLSEKEIGRRAMNRATKAHDAAAGARDARSSSKNVRAFSSYHPAHAASATVAQKETIGRTVRRARTSRNENPVTGKKQTALRAGRNAIKASVRKGTTNLKQGSKAMDQLKAMDPTTRRALVAQGGYAAGRSGSNFKAVKGQTISQDLHGIRKAARAASGAKPSANKGKPAVLPANRRQI